MSETRDLAHGEGMQRAAGGSAADACAPDCGFGVDARFAYVQSGMKRLRRGYTTGTCAALAAQAAACGLLLGAPPAQASLVTPAGIQVRVPVETLELTDTICCCGVQKDGGDDEDATDGLLVCAAVSRTAESGVSIEGGQGVGMVTKPGLDQPVGSAAINQVPRRMIAREVGAVASEAGYEGGLCVTVYVPGGREVGAKTFNPQLGIEGGISILGTSGIVEPRSVEALRASIEVEIRQAVVMGDGRLVVAPGNYGRDYVAAFPGLRDMPQAQCANFIGDALVFAARAGARELLLVGHAGKMVKLAAGVMNTHSQMADCRREVLCAHAALAGATQDCAGRLMEAATTDACLDILREAGLVLPVMASVARQIQHHLDRHAPQGLKVGALVFDGQRNELLRTKTAKELLAKWEVSYG